MQSARMTYNNLAIVIQINNEDSRKFNSIVLSWDTCGTQQ